VRFYGTKTGAHNFLRILRHFSGIPTDFARANNIIVKFLKEKAWDLHRSIADLNLSLEEETMQTSTDAVNWKQIALFLLINLHKVVIYLHILWGLFADRDRYGKQKKNENEMPAFLKLLPYRTRVISYSKTSVNLQLSGQLT